MDTLANGLLRAVGAVHLLFGCLATTLAAGVGLPLMVAVAVSDSSHRWLVLLGFLACAAVVVASLLGGVWMGQGRALCRVPLSGVGLALVALAAWPDFLPFPLSLGIGLSGCLTMWAVHWPAAVRRLTK
jgi:hypothetical protein